MEHQKACLARFTQLKANEEELNRIFIDIYGLQDELTPEVAERDVTVYRVIDEPNEEERKMPYVISMRQEIASLLSYMVGCMLGRYSPYVDGLLYAGGDWDEAAIHARIQEGAKARDWYDPALGLFLPDRDAIVPITDDDYFDDDAVSRMIDFVRKVYGADTLEKNLAFIARALGGAGTPREVIRRYFLSDFYADHLKTYQKRPIYWQFSSGKKNGFKALVYLHRYQKDSLARLRTDYVHELQERYRSQVKTLEDGLQHAAPAQRVKINKQVGKLKDQSLEIHQFEEKLHHLADQMIALDLDDGVKVNYAKFKDILETIK